MKPFSLVGIDGNAFSIMGYTAKAMKEASFSKEEIKKYHDDATSGDYHHLVCVSMQWLDKCNALLGLEDTEEDDWEEDDWEDEEE